ncbi:MAG TPA: hypothetical protein VF043_27815 [Ktedonobacteraceae bacterium]
MQRPVEGMLMSLRQSSRLWRVAVPLIAFLLALAFTKPGSTASTKPVREPIILTNDSSTPRRQYASRRPDGTLGDAPHVVANLIHRRGVADLQRDFEAAQRKAEEIAAPVVTYRIEHAFRVQGLGHIRLGVQDGLDTRGCFKTTNESAINSPYVRPFLATPQEQGSSQQEAGAALLPCRWSCGCLIRQA